MSANFRFNDEWLVRAAKTLPGVGPDDIERLRAAKNPQLGDALVAGSLATAEQIGKAVERVYAIRHATAGFEDVEKLALALVTEKLCQRHHLIPLKLEGETIQVAMSNPLDTEALADVHAASGRTPIPCYCLPSRIDALFGKFFNSESAVYNLVERLDVSDAVEFIENAPLPEGAEPGPETEAPVIQLVSALIAKAVAMNASDIHIEHEERFSLVRFRVDGLLRKIVELPTRISAGALVSRIKIISNLDISDRLRPQDGRAKLRVGGREVGLRVSTLPTHHGEKVVIRLLDPRSAQVSFETLGFSPKTIELLSSCAKGSKGMLLVTGPTGSGKTTTLYSLLNRLKSETTNMVTVEDPIEYKLEGINQVQINVKQKLGFAAVLRSVLRQDPDIILIGEIRDKETADIAVQAALTGHLVLSSLHTNDAPSTLARLADMGVERYKIGTSLLGVLSQRLVRRLCVSCKKPAQDQMGEPELIEAFKRHGIPARHFHAPGCANCDFSGYRGMLAIVEFLKIDEKLRPRISGEESFDTLAQAALSSGALNTMLADALWHVAAGDTSLDEIRPHVRLDDEVHSKPDSRRPEPAKPAPVPVPVKPAIANRRIARRVLIADDDRNMRSSLRDVLEQDGYTVYEAENGVQALVAICKQDPDLLVLDINMPKLDGLNTIKCVKKGLGNVQLPIIILTTISDDESEQMVMNLGADDFITKSSSLQVVLARINAVFRRMRREGSQNN